VDTNQLHLRNSSEQYLFKSDMISTVRCKTRRETVTQLVTVQVNAFGVLGCMSSACCSGSRVGCKWSEWDERTAFAKAMSWQA